jgi:hypothetical protein
LSGSKHVEFLLDKKLITPQPSKILDELYSSGKMRFDARSAASKTSENSEDTPAGGETMVLHKSDGKRIAQALEIPELDVELDRAVWQVEKALKAEKELKQEKANLDKASAKPDEKK